LRTPTEALGAALAYLGVLEARNWAPPSIVSTAASIEGGPQFGAAIRQGAIRRLRGPQYGPFYSEVHP